MEETELTKHRPDAAHLEHQPLDRLVALRRVLRQELPRFFGQVDQNRAGLEQRQRLAAGAIGVEDGRNLVVGVEREKFRRHLVMGLEADQMRLVRQAGFLQHDRHLDAVGRGQRVKLQPLWVPGGPLVGDGKAGEMGHGVPCWVARAGCPRA